MSQLTVQQSYLLCWKLLPDRNRKSMGLWYWELMSHPDPAVHPVGTLHSLEWFWVSRRIFVYSHHNTIVFFSKMSVRLSVCHTFLTMFLSLYHPEIFRSYYHWQTWCPCKRSRSEVKGQGHRGHDSISRFRTVTQVLIHILQWNDAQSFMLLRRGVLLLFKIICQISRSHGTKNHWFWPKLGVSGL